MSKKIFPYIIGLLGFILIATASWAFYGILNQGAGDILGWVGITNVYLQYGLIIIVVLVGLILTGRGFFKALEKLIGK